MKTPWMTSMQRTNTASDHQGSGPLIENRAPSARLAVEADVPGQEAAGVLAGDFTVGARGGTNLTLDTQNAVASTGAWNDSVYPPAFAKTSGGGGGRARSRSGRGGSRRSRSRARSTGWSSTSPRSPTKPGLPDRVLQQRPGPQRLGPEHRVRGGDQRSSLVPGGYHDGIDAMARADRDARRSRNSGIN